MPANTLAGNVTIGPGRVLDGWVWFWIQSNGQPVGAIDFRGAHIFTFRPKGGSSAVIGMWQLKP